MVAKKSVWRLRERVEDDLHVFAESRVEHAIGLVENARGSHRCEAWRGGGLTRPGVPTTMWTLCGGRGSGGHGSAAVDWNRVEPFGRAEAMKLLANLDREFTRRAEDERLCL